MADRITLNGQEYASWDEVPDDVRRQLAAALPDADGDGDGVPDLFQRGGLPGSTTVTTTTFEVDSRSYSSAEELPEDLRRRLEVAGMLPPRPPAQSAPQPPRQTLLNGVPLEAEPKKRWWQRLF